MLSMKYPPFCFYRSVKLHSFYIITHSYSFVNKKYKNSPHSDTKAHLFQKQEKCNIFPVKKGKIFVKKDIDNVKKYVYNKCVFKIT